MFKKLITLIPVFWVKISMCNTTNSSSGVETLTETMISSNNISLTSVLTVGAVIGITYISYRIYRRFFPSGVGPSSSLPSEESIPVVNNLDVDQGNYQLSNVIVTSNGLEKVFFVDDVVDNIDNIDNIDNVVSNNSNTSLTSIPENESFNNLPVSIDYVPIDPMLTDYRLLGGPFGLVRQFPGVINTQNIPLYQGYRLQELRGLGEIFNEVNINYLNTTMVADINFRCHNVLTGMIPHLNLNSEHLTPESYRTMLTTLQDIQANVEITQDMIIIKSARGDKSLLKFFNDLHYYDADITNLMNRIAKVITEIINSVGPGGFF